MLLERYEIVIEGLTGTTPLTLHFCRYRASVPGNDLDLIGRQTAVVLNNQCVSFQKKYVLFPVAEVR
jgi:hypothetical protein